MSNAIFNVPIARNEPVNAYAPGSAERESLLKEYHNLYNQAPVDIPMYIGAERVYTSGKLPLCPPHDHQKVIGHLTP